MDDSRVQRRIVSTCLRQWGFAVAEAPSGEAALAHCRETPPDIVLSDWMMPGMSGVDFCRAFRAMERANYGYFILLTTKSDKEEVALGLDAGDALAALGQATEVDFIDAVTQFAAGEEAVDNAKDRPRAGR